MNRCDAFFRTLEAPRLNYWIRAPRREFEAHRDRLLAGGRWADAALIESRRRRHDEAVAAFVRDLFAKAESAEGEVA